MFDRDWQELMVGREAILVSLVGYLQVRGRWKVYKRQVG